MANITYRVNSDPAIPGTSIVKGAPLTNVEVDANFRAIDIEVDQLNSSTVRLTGDQTIGGVKTFTGNLGIGVVPSAWGSTYRALDVRTGAIYDTPAGTASGFTFNALFNGTNWVYKGTGGDAPAVRYEQGFGTHVWFTAPTGTAGNAISFTQAMTLDERGNLGVGVTSPLYRLIVSRADGNAAFFTDGASADLAITCISGVTTLSPTTEVLAFGTRSTERARIDSDGNVIVHGNIRAGGQFIGNVTGNVVDPILTLGGSEGTAGQVPVSRGAGLPPAWVTPGGGTPDFLLMSQGVI